MIRKIIKIDAEKCNGCGACMDACHEEAIIIVNGKAKLLRDDYCDGLGNCLPSCPMNAISFEEREAASYDDEAVQARLKLKKYCNSVASSCPGNKAISIEKEFPLDPISGAIENSSQLRQWPIQIKLVPVNAPYFNNAHLLIAADCTAFAYGDFHNRFMSGKVTLIGCPKLDNVDYSDKLTEIIQNNSIQSITLVRMEVPCCMGMENYVKRALQSKSIPLHIVTISHTGKII